MAKAGKGVRSLSEMMAEKAQAARAAEPTPTPATAAAAPPAVFEDDEAPVPINIYVTAADRVRLRQFALQRRTTVQALGRRAWDLLLAEEGLQPLAPATSYVKPGTRRGG